MTKDEALKLALKAFEWNYNTDLDNIPACEKWAKMLKENIAAIKEALAQPEQEPVAWEGGEGWESLAWELCADENGEDSCNELIWEGGPIPEPWGDRWMKYEYEAKRLIALVQKYTTSPQPWEKFCDSNCVWTDHHPDCKLAEQEPVAAQCKFESEDLWLPCSIEHHNLVQSEPMKWPQYQTRLLYTTPPQDKPEYWPLDEWSEWRDMVVVNLMRHGNIDKHFARRLAYFYQSKAPQRKPLTDEEIILIVADCASSHQHTDIHFARAIEAAHGIKGLI